MRVIHVVPNEPINDFVLTDARYLKRIAGVSSSYFSVNLFSHNKIGLDVLSIILANLKALKIKAVEGDILHCHFIPSSIVTTACSLPCVLSIHESFDEYTNLWKKILRNAASKCLVMNVSKYNREYWKRHLKIQGRVIYHAVDRRIFNPKIKTTRIRSLISENLGVDRWVLSMGALDSNRGHHYVLDAIAHMNKKENQVGLVVKSYGGFASYKKYLFKLAEEKKVPFLLISKNLAEHELASLMGSCDVFVRPATRESFGIAPLEAQACGVPVMVNNCCSLKEIFGQSSLLVDVKNVPDFSRKIYSMLNDDELRENIIEKGLANASRFTWEQKVRSYLSVYKMAIEACKK